MSENNTIIWLKNTKNGLLFSLHNADRFLYSETIFVDATPEEVIDWKEGTYWAKREAEKATPAVQEVQTPAPVADPAKPEASTPPADSVPQKEPEAGDLNDLINKNKAELLAILGELDPENKLDDKTNKADIIEAIQFFRTEQTK